LLAPRPTPKLEDHPSSAVRGCLFNLFTATLHIGGRSSIRNPRTRHAVVTGTHIHGHLSVTVVNTEITATSTSGRTMLQLNLLLLRIKKLHVRFVEVLLLTKGKQT